MRGFLAALVSFVSGIACLGANPKLPRYGNLPAVFEPNVGQPGARDSNSIRYLARGSGGLLLLTDSGAVLVPAGARSGEPRLTMTLDAGQSPVPRPLHRLPGVSNYLLGSNPALWRKGVPQYARISYSGVWRGVDLIYHSESRQLEFDFLVHPRADPSVIRLSFHGAGHVSLDREGNLVFQLGRSVVVQRKPHGYQRMGDAREPVDVSYRLISESEGFTRVALDIAPYDRERELIIDPVLEFGALVGGSGEDFAQGLAVDGAGSAYITGPTTSPNLPGAGASSLRGPSDCFISKLDPAGTAILFTTYFGGSGDETCAAITVDRSGNVIVAGVTTSSDLPTTQGVVQRAPGGGIDGFAVKLTPAGSGLVYSTYLGASGSDFTAGIALDEFDNLWITGSTDSDLFPPSFDTTPQKQRAGGVDAFLIQLNVTGTRYQFSSFFGGNGDDFGTAVAVRTAGDVYLAGESQSSTLPGIGSNSFQRARRGQRDAFVARILTIPTELFPPPNYTTFLGGSRDDSATAITLDRDGRVFVTGFSFSADFPAQSKLQTGIRGGSDAFVSVFSPQGVLQRSTLLGGSANDRGTGIILSAAGIYVSGRTESRDFPPQGAVPAAPANAFVLGIQFDQDENDVVLVNTVLPGIGSRDPVLIARQAFGGSDEIYLAGNAGPGFRFPSSARLSSRLFAGGPADAFVVKLANADLDLDILISPFHRGSTDIVPGSVLELDFRAINFGPRNAENVVVTIPLPSPFIAVRCVAAGGTCTTSASAVIVRYASLSSGANVPFRVLLRAGTSASQDPITVQLQGIISSDTNDPALPNNTPTAQFNVVGVRPFTLDPFPESNFGTVNAGATATRPVQIVPNQPINVELTLVTETGATPVVFALASGQSASFSASAAVTRQLLFAPAGPGTFRAQLDVRVPSLSYIDTLNLVGVASQSPQLAITSVVDAAAGQNFIAANTWVSVLGNALAGVTRPWQASDFQGSSLPRSLDGVSVLINGRPGYVAFLSPAQINVLAPRDPTIGPVTVEVVTPAGRASTTIEARALAPAFFLLPQRQVAARHAADNGVVGPVGLFSDNPAFTRPARPGESVALFLNGLGETNPPYPNGTFPAAAASLTSGISVTVGGVPAAVQFAGLSVVPGLYQVNITVPASLSAGQHQVVATINGIQTPGPAFLTVQP